MPKAAVRQNGLKKSTIGRNSEMRKIQTWIRTHQLASFFLITLAFSWGLGFSYFLIFQNGLEILFPIAAVAICGPALAGIIITRTCNTAPQRETNKPYWIVFIIILLISSVVFLANNVFVNQAPFSPAMLVIIPIIVSPVAFILSAAFSRIPSIRSYLRSVYQVRRVWGWLLLAPMVMLGLDLLSIWISNLLGRPTVALSNLPFSGLELVKMLVITFLYQIFFFNLSGEEIGWRGFALPRLLAKTNPIVASLVLTFFWAIYHALYWGALGDPVLTVQYWTDTFIRLFPATVLINWFYIRSKGSILVAGVTHAAANTFFAYLPNLDWEVHTATIYGFSLLVILAGKWWKKLPAPHPDMVQAQTAVEEPTA